MAYERSARRHPPRSAVRRAWLFSFWLSLPAFIFAGMLIYHESIGVGAGTVLGVCLLLYVALIAAALTESFVRPLQTLSNVVASMREGDYSFRARGAGTRDAMGELAGEINALADLLQRQRVRSLESTALLARILEVMNAPLFAFDRHEVLQLINEAGTEFLGRSYARCIGRSAAELNLQGLVSAPDQSVHTIGDRSARWMLRKSSFRQEGAPHTLILLSDVSVPLQEEQQIAWKRLIRVLGHELSNSLAPIKSIAGSLLARVDTMDGDAETLRDFRRGLDVVESRADALHRFVQSYRLLAQLPPPRLRALSIAALLERVVLLEQRIPVQLGTGPSVSLYADSDQLEQMFINVLANAVDATLANQSTFVRVGWRVAEGSVWVDVEDTGMGIANADNLFVPFYTTKPKGSGVGLVLAQQIARAHGGEIVLANRDDGAGACASVRLPLAQSTGAAG